MKIVEEKPEFLPAYEKISIAFLVEKIFRIELSDDGLGGVNIFEEAVETPYLKDYDDNPEDRPTNWIRRFDLSNWGFLAAFDGEQRVGAAAIAWNTPDVFMLDARTDLACLWDLRVAPGYRGKGVGNALFEAAVEWAKTKNCRLFKVETQNVNVPACRFYVRQGCALGALNRFAYPELPHEVQLVFYRNL